MDATVACAAGLRMRGALFVVCSPDHVDAFCRSPGRAPGSGIARLGFGPFAQERSAGDHRSLCVHAQSSLSGKFSDWYRLYDCGRPGAARHRLRDNDFDRSLYLRYREYRAAVGIVVAWALLAAKALFFK